MRPWLDFVCRVGKSVQNKEENGALRPHYFPQGCVEAPLGALFILTGKSLKRQGKIWDGSSKKK